MKRIILFSIIFSATIIFLSSCHGRNNSVAAAAQIDSAKQAVIDSMQSLNNVKETKGMFSHQNATPAPVHRHYSAATGQRYPVSTYPAPRRKRWNWSTPAKGAVIGGAAGAAAGAIFDRRHRAAGAVIGGLIGAGAGTGAGVIIDNRNKNRQR